MKPTTGLALGAAALAIAAATPAAAYGDKGGERTGRVLDAMPGLPGMHGLGAPDDSDGAGATGNGKGNQGNGKGNDGDHDPNGKAWGWWRHHRPHPVSP